VSKYMGIVDWISIINDFRNRNIKILHRSALEALYPGKNRSLSVIIGRLERRGIIKRVAKNWYIIAPCDTWEIVAAIFPSAYLSLEWALHYHEILDQKINIITLIWLGKTKTVKSPYYVFELHKISKKLYFGFDDRLIAEPEKALLDMIYIRKKIIPELNFELLDMNRLKEYMQKYPKYVRKIISSKFPSPKYKHP